MNLTLLISFLLIALGNDKVTKQQIMEEIRIDDGVYDLTESTFDLMINWNDLVLVCFYEGTR
jgi:hypothetical protein